MVFCTISYVSYYKGLFHNILSGWIEQTYPLSNFDCTVLTDMFKNFEYDHNVVKLI